MTVRITYSIANDTLNGLVDSDRLENGIGNSNISSAVFERIITEVDDLFVEFDIALSAGDETTLDGIVAAHTGALFPNSSIIDQEFQEAKKDFFTELTYDGSGLLTDVDVYTDATKTTQLFSETLTYDGSNRLVTILITRLVDSVSITKTLNYDGSGILIDVTVVTN